MSELPDQLKSILEIAAEYKTRVLKWKIQNQDKSTVANLFT